MKYRIRKWLVRLLLVLISAALVLLIAFATGYPQRWILTAVLKTSFGNQIQIGRVRLFARSPEDDGSGGVQRRFSVSDVNVVPKDSAQPSFAMKSLAADYVIWPSDGRYFNDVRLSDAEIVLPVQLGDGTGVEQPSANPFDLSRVLPYIPKKTTVENLRLSIHAPSFGWTVDNLNIRANAPSANAADVILDGKGVEASWRAGSAATANSIPAGNIYVAYRYAGGDHSLEKLDLTFPGMIEINAGASIRQGSIDVDLPTARLANLDFSLANTRDLPVPFKLARLDLSGTRIHGKVGDLLSGTQSAFTIRATGKEVAVGPAGGEWYEGDFSLTADSQDSPQAGMTASLVLNRGQALQLIAAGRIDDGSISASLNNWSKEDLYAALPKSHRWVVSGLRLVTSINDAWVDLQKKDDVVRVTSTANLNVVRDGREETASLAFSTKAGLHDTAPVLNDTQFKLTAAGGKLSFAGNADLNQQCLNGQIALEEANPAKWSQVIMGKPVPGAIDADLTGTVALEAQAGLNAVTADVKLAAAMQPLFPADSPLTLSGKIAATGLPRWNAVADSLELRSKSNCLMLTHLTADLFSYDATAEVTAEYELADVPPLAALGVAGRMNVKGPLRHEHGVTKLAMSAAITDFASPWLAAPFSELKTKIAYDNLVGEGAASDISANIGGTAVRSQKWAWTTSPASAKLPFELESDLQLLLTMGLVTAVSGSGKATGDVTYGSAGTSAHVDFSGDVASATLAAWPAEIEGAAVQGSFQYQVGANAAGSFSARSISSAPIKLGAIAGTFQMQSGLLQIPDAAATLANGDLNAVISADLNQPQRPIHATVALKDIDLAAITSGLPMEAGNMSGIASGTLQMDMTSAGLSKVDINLESSEGFSVSVGMLKQVLTAQFVQQFSKRKFEKIMAEIVGTEAMRSFDSAKLSLTYQGDRIEGQAVLKSKRLDLTLDLSIDPAAVTEFLEMVRERG